MSSPSWHLRPLTANDVQQCAHIADEAFRNDRHTQFKTQNPTDPYRHAESMQGAFDHWLARPPGSVQGTVAVDDTTDRIIGWVVWGFRGFNTPEATAELEKGLDEARRNEASPTKEIQLDRSNSNAASNTADGSSDRTRLERYTSADLKNWMDYVMPPCTKCMYICSIIVHPNCQGRGIGSALIKQGTSRADEENVFCWVHSSESGAGRFAEHRFQEVMRLDIDLDTWNTQQVSPPEGLDRKWGIYTFRYMVRNPSLKG